MTVVPYAALRRDICSHLEQFLTPNRLLRMREVLGSRTRHITVILEDIYQPHNASAVLRSCDCYGIQDVYSIEDRHIFEVSTGVTRKAHQWLTLHKYHAGNGGTQRCLEDVKGKGYKIAVMTPEANMLLADVPLDEPLAFLFGTEKEGVSEQAARQAEYQVKIPMFGFSESLNVSVSVAIALYQTMVRLKSLSNETGLQTGLSQAEQEEIWYQWLKNAVKRSGIIEQRYLHSLR